MPVIVSWIVRTLALTDADSVQSSWEACLIHEKACTSTPCIVHDTSLWYISLIHLPLEPRSTHFALGRGRRGGLLSGWLGGNRSESVASEWR